MKRAVRKFLKRKKAVLFLVIFCTLAVFAFIQPLFPAARDPGRIYNDPLTGIQYINRKPDGEFLLGTNAIGQDVWARIWAGTRTSLLIGSAVALIRAAAGTAAGIVWGYIRRVQWIFDGIYNVFSNIPATLVLILLSCVLKPGIGMIILALSITGWIAPARMIRNKVLLIRDTEYNIASLSVGAGTARIMRRNILPELASVIILHICMALPEAVGSEIFITYLGIGLSGDEVSLGTLIQSARPLIGQAGLRYQLFVPVLILVLITVSVYVAGNEMADTLDPGSP